MRRLIPSPSLILTWSLAFTLSFCTVIPTARAQDKKFGYDSKVGGGKGEAFTAAEKQKIKDALTKMVGMTITTKEGAYSGAAIANDLTKMLDSGRLGKGVGADAGTAGTTKGDGKTSCTGDCMNISDHLLANATNQELANTLAHEWLHATQEAGTEAEQEAPAYQLGKQIYIDKGGAEEDAPVVNDTQEIENYKAIIAAAKVVVPDAKVPAKGAEGKRSVCGQQYYLVQAPGRVYLWSEGVRLDSVVAAPNQMFFTFLNYHTPPDCDRLLIFGTDRSVPFDPIATLTVVDANEFGFFGRTDMLLPGLRYPFSVTQDSTSGKLYVLDAHFAGQGIVAMQDLNDDLIPDTMQPFAPRGFAGVDSAEAISWAELSEFGNGLAVDEMDNRGDTQLVLSETLTLIRDTNFDGIADFSTLIRETDLASFAPQFTTVPQPGESSVEIQCMPGHLVQVVLTDASGDANFGSIGGGVGSPTGLPQMIPVATLSSGQFIKAVDQAANTQAALPTLVSAVTAVGPSDPRVAALRATPSLVHARTTLSFRLSQPGHARLVVFDASGRARRTLVDRVEVAGDHSMTWDGTDQAGQRVPSGVYFATLVSDAATSMVRLVVLR